MSKYLDKAGLSRLWDSILALVSSKSTEYTVSGDMPEYTSAMGDETHIVLKYLEPNAEKGVFFYRKAALFWDYIRSKADTRYSKTDTNTTYELTKSGSTITLTGSDGSKTSVTDSSGTTVDIDEIDGGTP